ncbi:MAG: 3-phosphoserine/phosphohydroxythreonine transaminase [Oscillospiraceae bacterium]|nr:3-phosphoserine/phosphohydroxythreonine transaminase [Oscillospiraceae bacterium]
MQNSRVYNFAAGPSTLPLPVLERAAAEMTNYGGSGMSVMEMSHRSKVYENIFNAAQDKLRAALRIPDGYRILFLQGGATLQFAAVALNLIGKTGKADYAITGNFSNNAYKEGKKYGQCRIAASSADRDHVYIPTQDQLDIDPEASYFHYCANNTVYGTEWKYIPDTGSVTLVSDMSSDILSRPVDVSRFGIIYAGAQKNMACAGVTVVIVREDILEGCLPITPAIIDYKLQISKNSMYNTPPAYNVYILGLVLDWLAELGGIEEMEKIKSKRAAMLYECIDDSRMFIGRADKEARSDMNVTFHTDSEELDAKFVSEATQAGFVNLKGYRTLGGMRVSIYNAMPMEGVEKLVDFMRAFEKNN